MIPPVTTLPSADAVQKLKYYQKGTFTVGNRLVAEAERTVQASQARSNALTCGHRACQGCGEALGARYAIDAAMRATNNNLIAVNATGCLEVFTTLIRKPHGNCRGCIRCSAMRPRLRPSCRRDAGSRAAGGAGNRAGRRRRYHDIGSSACPACSSATMTVLYICYDNEVT